MKKKSNNAHCAETLVENVLKMGYVGFVILRL